MKMRAVSRRLLIRLLIAFGVLAVWYFRTWFHDLVMLLYRWPVIWEALLVWALIHFALLSRWRPLIRPYPITTGGGKQGDFRFLWLVSPLVLLTVLVVGLVTANFARSIYLANAIDYQPIERLPESKRSIRLMPREVAYRYAQDALQLSQYRLKSDNIAMIDNNLSWVFPLAPDGLVISFLKKNYGIITVDASRQEKNTSLLRQSLAIGEGMQLTDNLWWNLYRHRYLVDTEDPYYVVHRADIITVVPVINYSLHFRWGVLYTVPHFAGVFIVDPKGAIRFLAPDEAMAEPALAGNRLFPEGLARVYIAAHRYRLGVINRLFVHEDQIDLQDVKRPDGTTNRQPFLMLTEDGLKWFASAEPFGASHGVFKVFLVDARTGEVQVLSLPAEQTLTGPVRAIDYVRKGNPLVDWSRFDVVEPLPFVRDGVLYWKLAVIPRDGAGIAYQAFVDSRTNDVYEVETDEQIQRFIEGGAPLLDGQDKPAEQASEEEVVEQVLRKLDEVRRLLEELLSK